MTSAFGLLQAEESMVVCVLDAVQCHFMGTNRMDRAMVMLTLGWGVRARGPKVSRSLPTLRLPLNILLMLHRSALPVRTAVFEVPEGRAKTLRGGVRKAAWHVVGTLCTYVK